MLPPPALSGSPKEHWNNWWHDHWKPVLYCIGATSLINAAVEHHIDRDRKKAYRQAWRDVSRQRDFLDAGLAAQKRIAYRKLTIKLTEKDPYFCSGEFARDEACIDPPAGVVSLFAQYKARGESLEGVSVRANTSSLTNAGSWHNRIIDPLVAIAENRDGLRAQFRSKESSYKMLGGAAASASCTAAFTIKRDK